MNQKEESVAEIVGVRGKSETDHAQIVGALRVNKRTLVLIQSEMGALGRF